MNGKRSGKESARRFGTTVLLTISCVGMAERAWAQSDRDQTTPTQWWWMSNVTADAVTDRVNLGFRIFDLEVVSASPLRFSAVFVRDTGVYDKTWWWYFGLTAAQVGDRLEQNGARLIDLETYEVNGQIRYAVVMIRNAGADAAGWWWLIGVTTQQISDFLSNNPARIIDLDTYVIGGQRRYSAVMIQNTGANARAWYWHFNVSSSFIADRLRENNARLIDLEVHNVGSSTTYTCVMERTQGQAWWWYIGVRADQIEDLTNQNGARLIDLERYNTSSGTRFTLVMINNSNAVTTRVGELMRDTTDGVVGLYLKRVNGPVLASLQSDRVFEPASMIKVLHHAHAMSRVQAGAVSLNTMIPTFTGPADPPNCNFDCPNPCPVDTNPFQIQLRTALQQMMEQSHNTRTQAVRVFFGQGNINATAQALGMTDSFIQHRLGCGNDALANPNRLTLRDAGRLYEEVATGFLSPANRDTFYSLMTDSEGNGLPSQLSTIITQEANAAGLTPTEREEFRSQFRNASKGGSYTLCSPGCVEHRTRGGWIEIPFVTSFCAPAPREYVHGAFVNDAGNATAASNAMNLGFNEVLREEVRAAADSWADCGIIILPCPTESRPRLVRIQGGAGPAADEFISPKAESVPFDTITVELNTAVNLTQFEISSDTPGGRATTATLTHRGRGLHTLSLSRGIPVGEWVTIRLGTVSQTNALCRATIEFQVAQLPDDVNQDGVVSIRDATAFGVEFRGAGNPHLVDLNDDGVVNIRDATEFGTQWSTWNGRRLGGRVVIFPQ